MTSPARAGSLFPTQRDQGLISAGVHERVEAQAQ